MPSPQEIEDRQQLMRRSFWAGTAATCVMTVLALASPTIGFPPISREVRELLQPTPTWFQLLAWVAHFAYGSLAGVLFAVTVRKIDVTRGIVFGFFLWGLAMLVYAPLCGLGVGCTTDPQLAIGILPAHLLYGITLGAAAPRGEIVQPIEDGLNQMEYQT